MALSNARSTRWKRITGARRIVAVIALALGAAAALAVPLVAADTAHAAVEPIAVRGDHEGDDEFGDEFEDDVNAFSFTSFEGIYTVGRDDANHSTLVAKETFVAEFPDFDQNKGIIRAIPQGYDGVDLHTTVRSVTDQDGNSVPYETEWDDGFIELALGTDDYVHGRQTYVITYTQRDVVRAFDDTAADEFYWDAPGNGFSQVFERATMTVRVAAELTSTLTGNSSCYVGAYGSSEKCGSTETADDEFTTFASDAVKLDPSATITMAVGFAKGTFAAAERPGNWPIFTTVPIGVSLGIVGVGVVALVARLRSTKNAPGRGLVIPQYSAPKDLSLYAAGDVVGKAENASPATIVDLAVRGVIRILDYPITAKGATGSTQPFTLQLIDPTRARESERELLASLFSPAQPGAVRELGVADSALATWLSLFTSRARSTSVAAGYRERKRVPGAVILMILSILGCVTGIGLLVASLVMYGFTGWVLIAFLVGIGGVVATVLLSRPRTALTQAGAELEEHLRGIRLYLTVAEEDRIRMLQSPSGAERVDVDDHRQVIKLYEKLLPYAILWGIEKDWSRVLVSYYENIGSGPEWYWSSRGFSGVGFAAGLSTFSSASGTSTPWAASASSSSSSFGGSMGGGFAGGGGGGGGGGGR